MQGYARRYVGNFVLAVFINLSVPVVLLIAVAAAGPGVDGRLSAASLGLGLLGALSVPFSAKRLARADFPRISRGDVIEDAGHHEDDAFALWSPRADDHIRQGRLARADVLEATFVSYTPDSEASFVHYVGDFDPTEVRPLIRLKLLVRGDGIDSFETTDEVRVQPLCLAAVTAGRLAVYVDPDSSTVLGVDWPRSALLSGARTCKVLGLDGRSVELTGHPDLLMEQMQISRAAGDIALVVDTVVLERLEPEVAARIAGLAERARTAVADRDRPAPPGEGPTWVVDDLPGEKGAFGRVGKGWARRGGRLARARFLEIRGTTTFQADGPVVKTMLRIRPEDGAAPFDVRRKLTVPMNYLALLHRTKEVVVRVSPNRRSYDIDWERTNLLAGVGPAVVIGPDGQQVTLTGQADPLWAVMKLLVANAVSNPSGTLDLREHRPEVAEQVLDVIGRTG
ncbi:hypothetical protein [Streptomyces fildesensis]|uniref:hypothetical protein n=1 Tax=Streptomyces fildesensis TaxID=375757 RepID=UPI0018E04D50|nr:hypothetical protein [Streptomyces fildesensis]